MIFLLKRFPFTIKGVVFSSAFAADCVTLMPSKAPASSIWSTLIAPITVILEAPKFTCASCTSGIAFTFFQTLRHN